MSISIIDSRVAELLTKKSFYKKIHLLNMPKLGLNNPPMGPAIIQSISKQMGSEVLFRDINLDYFDFFENSPHKGILLHSWPETGAELEQQHKDELNKFIKSLDLDSLLNCDVIALSVFSAHSHCFTEYFLQYIRSLTFAKIIVGGAGVAVTAGDTKSCDIFGQKLLKQNLIDYYILGEGELSWRAFLSQTLPWAGINSAGESLADFSHVPLPDYSGYYLDRYINSKVQGITIGVEGSRGCVRNCTFCDVRSFWKKYKFKDGNKLAQELIDLKETYNAKHFFFNDSLVNGSDRAFRDFIHTLAEYNKSSTDNKIHWSGYYIIKPKNTYKEQDWINLRDSGVKSLFIGIESGSERVRDHMRKKFSNQDIDFAMSKIQRYNIRCTWLMIIGYPTETEEDFQDTLNLLRRYQHMAVDGTIDTVALGLTLGIIEESPLNDMKTELGIHSLVGEYNNGIYWQNETSDFKIRLRRRIIAEEVVQELGYNSWTGDMDQVDFFRQKLLEIENKIVNQLDIAGHHG